MLCGGVSIVNGVFAVFDISSGEKVFCDFLSSGKFFCKYDFQHAVHGVQHEALERMICGEDPFDVLGEYGLEPDYLESMILG